MDIMGVIKGAADVFCSGALGSRTQCLPLRGFLLAHEAAATRGTTEPLWPTQCLISYQNTPRSASLVTKEGLYFRFSYSSYRNTLVLQYCNTILP